MVLKVLDDAGRGYISDVIAALDYVVTHRTELNLRVVNMSIATSVTESFDVDPLAQATKAATAQGAGRRGGCGQQRSQRAGRDPVWRDWRAGQRPVGADGGRVESSGTVDRTDDMMASFSSRGPTAVD